MKQELGLPMYITETGICDHTSLKRPEFFHSYLDQVRTAQSYCPWHMAPDS